MIDPSTQSGSTTTYFFVQTTTTMATTTTDNTVETATTTVTAKKTTTTPTTATTTVTAKKTTTTPLTTTATATVTAKKTTTTTTTATTTATAATAKKTKASRLTSTSRGQKRKGTVPTNNKKKKGLTNKQVTTAKNKVVLDMEQNLLPKNDDVKRAFFNEEEDTWIAKAYVNITQYSKVGAGQKGKAFWRRVKGKFDLLATRNWPWKSIQSRFLKTIAIECMKFLSFLQRAKEVKESGWSIEQYIEAANILFIEQHKKSFKRKKCMAILVDLPKYSVDPITVINDEDVDDGGMVAGGSNPIMAVQGSNKERPMGRKKAKKLDRNNPSNGTSKGTSDATRMIDALERKNELNTTVHRQRSLQKCAELYLKMGNKVMAQQLMTQLEEDIRKCSSVPTTVDVRSFSDDGTVGSGCGKTNDSRLTTLNDDDSDDNNDGGDDVVDVIDDNNDDADVVIIADDNDVNDAIILDDGDVDGCGDTNALGDTSGDDNNNHQEGDIPLPNLKLNNSNLEQVI